MEKNKKSFVRRYCNWQKLLIIIITVILCTFAHPGLVKATCSSGIKGNGTSGIFININGAPYTTFATYSWGQYAYGREGCAWFASARVKELTGKGNTILSGWAWYNTQYSNYGFSRGSEPRAKALACYGNHVAVVEAVNGDTVTVSQGGMGGLSDAAHGYCVISTMSRAKLESQGGCGVFYGYVYLDADNQGPVISNYRVSDVTKDGFKVSCTVTDNVGVAYVDFLVWPNENGDWDYRKQRATLSGNTASCYVKTEEHHNYEGNYAVHLQAYDYAGNMTYGQYDWIYVDRTPPTISNYMVSDVTKDGFKVSCTVNDNIGVSYVDFLVWPNENGDWDYRKQRATLSGNTASCYVKTEEHHNYEGNYAVHLQAYDYAGNMTYGQYDWIHVDRTPPIISDVEIVDISSTGYTVKCKVTDPEISRVQFPTWYENNNPFNSDFSWETSPSYSGKLENGKYVFRVNTSDYNNQIGKYHTHIYAWDKYGNKSECYSTETTIQEEHKHTYTSRITKQATCTTPGTILYTCTDNDDSYEKTIPATGHRNKELRNVRQATCAREGYTGDTYCKDCNTKLSSGKTIAKKAHTWDAGKITKQATCTVNGTKTYTCTSCKTTKTSSIAATGHTKELRNVKTATCAHAGYTGDTYCKKCNKKLATGKTIAQKAHTWNKGVVTTAATCTKQGVRTYTCTVCKGTRKAAIAATGHRNKVLKNARQATCAKAGYTGDTYCKDCNAKLSSGKTIAKKAHTWDAGKVTKKATCTVKGTKTYTCKICKATKTSSIAATGHRHTELRNVKKATCGQEGYTGDTYCKDCKAKVSSGKVIAKTPHKNKIVKFAKESTCKSEGYTGDIFCYDCGSLIEEGAVIDKLEHIWDSGKITVQPTAAKTGVRTYTCENCGVTKKTTIPVLNLVGKTVQDKTTNGVYKVLSKTSVEYTKPIAKRAAVNIPATVKLSGKTFNVTKISANAFRNNTVMKSLTIGSNVTTIGANAFYGCKNLNTVVIKTAKLTSKTVGANAFAKTGAKPVVTVPAKQFNTYKTLLRSKGMSTKAVYKK